MGVFISYSSKEYEEAYRLKTVIEGNGITCWMAPQSIPAGSDYSSEIPAAITDCEAFVLVLSAESQSSTWVPKELDYALSCNKIIIPFHIDESDLTDSFNFRLTNVQRIEAFNRISEAYQQLIYKLKALVSTPVTSEHVDYVAPSVKRTPISFNQRPGKEIFLFAREAKPDTRYTKGPIRVDSEKGFWILAEILNDCTDESLMAENVRLKVSIHRINDTKTVVKASVLSSNSSPQEVNSDISFISDYPFELHYLPGSAYMYSELYGLHSSKSMHLTDDIMSDKGAILRFRKIDGLIPGGYNNTVTVSIKVTVSKYETKADVLTMQIEETVGAVHPEEISTSYQRKIDIGEEVELGVWDGKPIRWHVIDRTETALLLLAQNGWTADFSRECSYKDSLNWMNLGFRKYFSDRELDTIIREDDRCFSFLDIEQARRYARAVPAIKTGVSLGYKIEKFPWWLKKSRKTSQFVPIVRKNGAITERGVNESQSGIAGRPVAWIDITKYAELNKESKETQYQQDK